MKKLLANRQPILNVLFPLILVLFPLLKINQGIDLTDTAYSLGNYRFWGETGGVWMLLTFLSNIVGHFFTLLPFGGTMLGMKFYTGLLVSLMALLGYRFFKTKMPPVIAFAGEMAAIGLCWCPTVILYNYMTYLLLLLGAIFLFRGLAGCRARCLIVAGVFLGLNTFVRFPGNALEVSLILAVWFYGVLKKKTFAEIAKETGLCVLGYLVAFLVMLGCIVILYGTGAPRDMITGVFGMAGSASDYTLGEMLLSILDAYLHGGKWLLYMLLCILPGIPFLVIFRNKYLLLSKIVYCVCIGFLFFVLGKWGMYNFRYFQKESALLWSAVFLLVAIAVLIWMLFSKTQDHEWKLISALALIIILITPLGSNNYIWPVINNLFFITPIIFWILFKFARWGRTYLDTTGKVPLFPVKAMLSGILLAFFIQAIGIGCFYVFLDGESGEKRNAQVPENEVLRGMYTNAVNGETLEEITIFMLENKAEYTNKKLILYGNIPGLAYYLNKPSAISTTWADLGTSSLPQLQSDLAVLQQGLINGTGERPLIIITPQLAAYLDGNQEAMTYWGTDEILYKEDQKLETIIEFIYDNEYRQVFGNEAYVVYE